MKKVKQFYGSVKNKAAVAGGLMIGASSAMAVGPDYSSITSGIDASTVVTAIIAMGVVKVGPNVAKWATNKLANFFR